MINIERTLVTHYPQLLAQPGAKWLIKLLRAITHEDEINEFIQANQHLRGFHFLDKVLETFQFDYQVAASELKRIPAEGRVVIVANHPIGSLDGLALLKLVRSVRPDVRIVANQLLSELEPIRSLFIPIDNLSGKVSHKQQYKAMKQALEDDQALIIFPAGEVSRIRPNGVRDGRWKAGFLRLALKTNAPILPIRIEARNSALFYSLSAIYKPLGTAMLIEEMFKQEQRGLVFHVGKLILPKSLLKLERDQDLLAARFRKYVYRLGTPKKLRKTPLFEEVNTIAHPVDGKALRKALRTAELLGQTADGKHIYLYDLQDNCPVMDEIGRLRELTFRTVEEGTGLPSDIDAYDRYFRHLVLWDDESLDIVGAYRIGEGAKIVAEKGMTGFYSASLFELNEDLLPKLQQGIELGRSFVQPKYWGMRSLDYLWYGIGAYLKNHPDVQYLFGPVSLSAAYPEPAKQKILSFYWQQFGSKSPGVKGHSPYRLTESTLTAAQADYGQDYITSFKRLNYQLEQDGVKVPTLYKQYTELCEQGGCEFHGFNLDEAFGGCVDSFILVSLDKVKPKKRQRYLG
jgi:putative hemolysin